MTPGLRTSEFKIAVLAALANIANANQHWTSWRQALLPTLAAIGYILSRGLAKTEPRSPVPPAPPAA